MLFGVDPRDVTFERPEFLWLLVVPMALVALWLRLQWNRWSERRAMMLNRVLPVSERLPVLGDSLFWLCMTLALGLTALALARPVVTTALMRTAGVDVIVLQDGSSSMRVMDVDGDRWRRSMRFLRTLGESLRWKDDRVAMAVFAHIAAPQVRLTTDPNTYFFFLDHLAKEPPFRLEDDTTWDTNIELGIYWGLRLVERDQDISGASPNAKVFVLITDGQAWSGEVAKSIELARAKRIPIFTVGVGSTTGGLIPDAVPTADGAPGSGVRFSPVRSALDRESLVTIAARGAGRYLELDRDGDREIAATIIDAARRQSGNRGVEEQTVSLYWPILVAAAVLIAVGAWFLRSRAEMLLQLAGGLAVWVALTFLMR